MVIYHYWQHHSLESDEIDTLPEALARAKSDVEWGTAAPEKIVLEDGTALDSDAIMEQSGYYSDIELTGPIVDSTLTQ